MILAVSAHKGTRRQGLKHAYIWPPLPPPSLTRSSRFFIHLFFLLQKFLICSPVNKLHSRPSEQTKKWECDNKRELEHKSHLELYVSFYMHRFHCVMLDAEMPRRLQWHRPVPHSTLMHCVRRLVLLPQIRFAMHWDAGLELGLGWEIYIIYIYTHSTHTHCNII